VGSVLVGENAQVYGFKGDDLLQGLREFFRHE
jgi:hypothetical protein